MFEPPFPIIAPAFYTTIKPCIKAKQTMTDLVRTSISNHQQKGKLCRYVTRHPKPSRWTQPGNPFMASHNEYRQKQGCKNAHHLIQV